MYNVLFFSPGEPHKSHYYFHIIISGKFHEILQALGLYSWIMKPLGLYNYMYIYKSEQRLHFFLHKSRYQDSICTVLLFEIFKVFLPSCSAQCFNRVL